MQTVDFATGQHFGEPQPPDMMVVVSTGGKLFHAAACPFIHDNAHIRTIVAQEALKEGYTPCVRCMREYLRADFGSQHFPLDRAAQGGVERV